MTIPIDDPEDPRIEAYRCVRERDLRGREDRFVVEGEVVLRVFLKRSRLAPVSLLIADTKVAGLRDVLSTLPASVPVFAAKSRVMEAIVGFPIHRGILAIGRREAAMQAEDLLRRLPEDALVVGLVGLANHDNVGGIFRNAAAFGCDAVVADAATCDPLYRKAIRVSVGGTLLVPFARVGSGGAMIDVLERSGFDVVALSPAGREPLSAVRRRGRMAVLLGAEGPGLPTDVLDRVRTAAIPMAGGFDSLNVATASGIVLHHLRHFGHVAEGYSA